MRNKPLELTLYAAGAGAFGVFLRWLEDQLAFNEEGLADPSAFHVIVPLFLIACVVVFWRFQQEIERKHWAVPTELGKALYSELQLHTALSILAGFVLVLGGLLLFAKSETDRFVGALRLLAVQPGERVIDWFCGLGNFTLPIATQAAKVFGVEGSEALVQRARANYEAARATRAMGQAVIDAFEAAE